MASVKISYYKLNNKLVQEVGASMKQMRFSKYAIRNHLEVDTISEGFFDLLYEEVLTLNLIPNKGDKVYLGSGDKKYNVRNVFSIRSKGAMVEYHIELI